MRWSRGIVLILLFMMPPKEIKDGWFNLALLPLNLVGNFTDVVSYVRLYAVGTAGLRWRTPSTT
jgi:V/A-type H+/Na+-transporting ATPase subunit I